ncbi:UNVERIFIED_CONTAM: hypothetical protein FKN15_041060 [Acipenser sinensis]
MIAGDLGNVKFCVNANQAGTGSWLKYVRVARSFEEQNLTPCHITDDQIAGDLGNVKFCINANQAGTGSWLKYVRVARSFEEQNLTPCHITDDQICYKAIKDIEAGEELLVYMDGDFPEGTMAPNLKDEQMYRCEDCEELLSSKLDLHRHQKYSCSNGTSIFKALNQDFKQEREEEEEEEEEEEGPVHECKDYEQMYRCEDCEELLSSKLDLHRHQKYSCSNGTSIFNALNQDFKQEREEEEEEEEEEEGPVHECKDFSAQLPTFLVPFHGPGTFPFQFLPNFPHSLYPFTDRALNPGMFLKDEPRSPREHLQKVGSQGSESPFDLTTKPKEVKQPLPPSKPALPASAPLLPGEEQPLDLSIGTRRRAAHNGSATESRKNHVYGSRRGPPKEDQLKHPHPQSQSHHHHHHQQQQQHQHHQQVHQQQQQPSLHYAKPSPFFMDPIYSRVEKRKLMDPVGALKEKYLRPSPLLFHPQNPSILSADSNAPGLLNGRPDDSQGHAPTNPKRSEGEEEEEEEEEADEEDGSLTEKSQDEVVSPPMVPQGSYEDEEEPSSLTMSYEHTRRCIDEDEAGLLELEQIPTFGKGLDLRKAAEEPFEVKDMFNSSLESETLKDTLYRQAKTQMLARETPTADFVTYCIAVKTVRRSPNLKLVDCQMKSVER